MNDCKNLINTNYIKNYIFNKLLCLFLEILHILMVSMAERQKDKQKGKLKREVSKEFLETNELFVLQKDSRFEIKTDTKEHDMFLQLFNAMSIDERITYYFDNFESIFVSLYPDDVGYFSFVPKNEQEWKDVENGLTKLKPK